MKKKIYLILAILPVFVLGAFSQNFMLGPKAGLSFSQLRVSETYQVGENLVIIDDGAQKYGYHLGAFARFGYESFFLQPELYYTSSGGTLEIDSDVAVQQIVELKYDKIDFPVLGGLKFDNLRVEIGPVFSVLLNSSPNTINNVLDEIETDYSLVTMGIQAGIGLDVGALVIDLKYEDGLSQFGQEITIGNQNFNMNLKNPQVLLSLGINFF
ncbi:MAG: porin family protein [Bacteroidota bacterium]